MASCRVLQAVAITSSFGVCKLGHLHIMGIHNSVDTLENNLEFLKS